jgi:hypothetical protein
VMMNYKKKDFWDIVWFIIDRRSIYYSWKYLIQYYSGLYLKL